jgi:cell filamentation protein
LREGFDAGKQEFVGGPARFFTPSAKIEAEASTLFGSLKADGYLRGLTREEFSERGAELLHGINKIHAFPEGNGRAQRAFIEQLAREAGHPIDFAIVTEERMIRASVAGMDGDLAPMTRMFSEATSFDSIQKLQRAIDFLDEHRNVIDWNSAYLATSTPGQSYSGILVGTDGLTGRFPSA